MSSIQRSQVIRKLRNNLYQMPHGQLVGFGPVEAENGISFCYNCYEAECEHVEAIAEAWLGGMSVEAQSIPFNREALPTGRSRQVVLSRAGRGQYQTGV